MFFCISSLFLKYISVYIISAECLLFIFLLGEFMYKEIYDLANICKHLCTSSPFQGIKYYHHSRESLSLVFKNNHGSDIFPIIDYFVVVVFL